MNTTLFIAIIAVIIVVLALIFLRRHDDSKSDYKEQPFKHSDKKWVFNGILDIDHPVNDPSVINDYEGELQLMVKKGYAHYDVTLLPGISPEKHLGLFRAVAKVNGEEIVLVSEGVPFAKLPAGLVSLRQKVMQGGGETDAYGFVAKRHDTIVAEACVKVK